MDLTTFCDMWSLKQLELMPLGHIKIFELEPSATSWLPTHHPYRSACGINYLVNYLYKIVGNSTNSSLKS